MLARSGMPLALTLASVLSLVALVIFGAQEFSSASAGSPLLVTKSADTNDGTCDADCSLREAIITANNNPGPDTINIPADTYTLSIAGNGEDAAATGDLDITDDVTLHGAGAASTTMDAAGLDRVFDVMGSITVGIDDLTVTGGIAGPSTSRNGGGIQNSDATLTLTDVVITGNATGNFNGASGGGLVNVDSGVVTINSSEISGNTAPNNNNTGAGVANTESGVMTINDTTISGNTALQDGGGVMNANVGFLTINNSSITGNSGRFGGGFSHGNGATAVINDSTISGNTAIDGGGVENDQGTTITINRTTISGNTATNEGGGVFVSQSGIVTINHSTISGNDAVFGGGIQHEGSETVTVNNSTISGNMASDHSGGINSFGTGIVLVESSTISDNTADSDSNGVGDGGGVGVGSGTVQVKNSIIAGNHDPTSDPDCFGTLTSLGYNLIRTVSAGCTIAGDVTGNVVGQDPLLGALGDNGGSTDTHALQSGSPAIDAASPDCPPPSDDQRGVSRPRDGDGDMIALCDIGAYEAPGDPPTPIPTPTPTPTSAPTPTPTLTPTEAIWGDNNCSQQVDPVDSLFVLRGDAGLPTNTGDCPDMGADIEVQNSSPHIWGDVDCTGAMDPVDSLKILRHDAGLSVSQEANCPEIGTNVTIVGG